MNTDAPTANIYLLFPIKEYNEYCIDVCIKCLCTHILQQNVQCMQQSKFCVCPVLCHPSLGPSVLFLSSFPALSSRPQCVISIHDGSSIHEGSNVSVLFLFTRVRTSVCCFYPRGFERQCVVSVHEGSNVSVLFLSTRVRTSVCCFYP